MPPSLRARKPLRLRRDEPFSVACGPRKMARHLHNLRYSIVFPVHHVLCSDVSLFRSSLLVTFSGQRPHQQHDGPLRLPTRCAVRSSAGSCCASATLRQAAAAHLPVSAEPLRVPSDGKVQVKGCSWLTPAL